MDIVDINGNDSPNDAVNYDYSQNYNLLKIRRIMQVGHSD